MNNEYGTKSGMPKKIIVLCPAFNKTPAHFYLRVEDENWNIDTFDLKENSTLPGAVASARDLGHPDVFHYCTDQVHTYLIPSGVNHDLKV